jgi:transcriptional regulator
VRHNPHHFVDDPEIARRLVRENPWGILVSFHDDRLVASHYPVLLDEDGASHYPVLLDEDGEELAVFTDVGRPDDQIHIGSG